MTDMTTITITVGGIITIPIIITARIAMTIIPSAGIIITIIITIATTTIDTKTWQGLEGIMSISMLHSLNHVAGVHDVDKLNLSLRLPAGVLRHEICTCRRSTC